MIKLSGHNERQNFINPALCRMHKICRVPGNYFPRFFVVFSGFPLQIKYISFADRNNSQDQRLCTVFFPLDHCISKNAGLEPASPAP